MKKFTLAVVFALSLSFAFAVQAQVKDVQEKTSTYKMVYPVVSVASPVAEQKINGVIANKVATFKKEATKPDFHSSALAYKLWSETPERLSLTMTEYHIYNKAANGYTHVEGYVFDKKTGKVIPLTKYFTATPAELEQAARHHLYSLSGGKVKYTWLNSVKRVPKDYFIVADGTMGIIFQEIELAPHVFGPTYIKLTPAFVKLLQNN